METFRFNIRYQAPANAIFAGIGVVLLVCILHVSLAKTILTVYTGAPRLLKMRTLVKKR